jgi:tripartite-type tricarboxylate transporter receptor subunit TctC
MKKLFVVFFGVLLMLSVVTGKEKVSGAEKYPAKPITFIVPVAAGGGIDVGIRPFCENLGSLLGQPVFVVNKPGAGSSEAYRAVHDAKPDGYTIGVGITGLINLNLVGLLPYDHHDFTVLGGQSQPIPIIVGTTKGKRTFKTFKEVIEFAKLHPDEISMACGTKGQNFWTIAKDIESALGIKFHIIPLVGGPAVSMVQVAGGHVEVGIVTLGEGKSQIDAGNVIPLAVAVPGKRRIPIYPNVPCVDELGYGNTRYRATSFIIGPPKMPKEVTEVLLKAIE